MIKRLGIIGDLHGEHRRLEHVLDWFAGGQVDALVCTGDIADGRGDINRCCTLLEEAGVLTVAGNHDRWLLGDRVRHLPDAHTRDELSDDSAAFLTGLPRWRRLETASGPLLLCHGVMDNDLAKVWPGTARMAAEASPELDDVLARDDCRFMVNGHMHFRVLIDFTDLLLLNAGTLKGERAGVTVMDFAAGSVGAYHVASEPTPRLLVEKPLVPGDERQVWASTASFDGSWDPVTLYG